MNMGGNFPAAPELLRERPRDPGGPTPHPTVRWSDADLAARARLTFA